MQDRKKILIVSSDKDFLAYNVINWIRSKNHLHQLYSFEEIIQSTPINIGIGISTTKMCFDAVWYRRTYPVYNIPEEDSLNDNTQKNIAQNNYLEQRSFFKSLFSGITARKVLSNPNTVFHDKISILKEASKLGLNIPETIVSNSKSHVTHFLKEWKEAIVKPLSDTYLVQYKKEAFLQHTSKISVEDTEQFPDYFLPSIFQKRINKDYEIRTVFIVDAFYSVATFGDFVDSRTDIRSNNYLPYKLPASIEKKLTSLIQTYNTNYATMDIIKSKDGGYIFLDINFNGQIGVVDKFGNYNLESKIAEYLCN